MASIVITALRDGDGPSADSLGLAGLAREIADRVGATVYASCSLGEKDDLDGWVSALGKAGVDRIACARSTADAPISEEAIHAELARRLEPLLVLVPASAAATATSLGEVLSAPVIEDATFEWERDACQVGERVLGDEILVATHHAAPPEGDLGGEDIDVLFFDVEDDGVAEPETEATQGS